jgi:four helix bundle protein
MRDFRDLHVWERSHRLTLAIYAATVKFPREELYGLKGQILKSGD